VKLKIIQNEIFNDDCIIDIKQKIILYCDNNIKYEDIYLYSIQESNIDLKTFFNENMNNEGRINIDVLQRSNFVFKNSLQKDSYSYDDILDIVIPNKKNVSLGISLSKEIVVNPFIKNDKDYTNYTSQDRSFKLISEYKINNEINMYTKGFIDNIYFTDLKLNKDINKYKEKYDLINLINNNSKLTNITNHNLDFINIKIRNKIDNIDLNRIFKNINSSNEIPLIKYNPSNRKDRIFRLYAPYRSYNNQKIPYLNKNIINRFIIEEKGKYKMNYITFYYIIDSDILTTIIVTIYKDNTIEIIFDTQNKSSVKIIEEYIKNILDNLIYEIYQHNIIVDNNEIFKSLYDIDVSIRNMNCNFTYKCNKSCKEILNYF